MNLSSRDPRASSTDSLAPDAASEHTGRRRLLLVYLHGFMGNETSFRSFPAHVHNLVSITLADSHVVHTKIYPRYQSRYSLEVARDAFSKWLAPHQDQWTDVVLLGHSMGGLLAADIALAFRHHIVGLVNFDVPFLGMHPGIIKAGLGSMFNPALPPQDMPIGDVAPAQRPSRLNTLYNPKPSDPNYNPSFTNDVRLPVRKGWENTLHWFSKHYADGLRQATKGLVKSHMEFGGAMADYRTLKDRYVRVRALEEDNEQTRQAANPGVSFTPRIRFVNYYTTSTGRVKKPKSPKPSSPLQSPSSASHADEPNFASLSALSLQSATDLTGNDAATADTRASQDQPEHHDTADTPVPPEELIATAHTTDANLNHVPDSDLGKSSQAPSLPDIPPIPQEPPFVDLMQYTDKAARRTAEKEHDQALKEYQRAVKARNKVINERTKIEEKWEKQRRQASRSDSMPDSRNAAIRESNTPFETPDMGSPQPVALKETLGSTDLGDPIQQPTSNSPYGTYDFSRSAILTQPQSDQMSATDSSYTLSTVSSETGSHTPSTQESHDPHKPQDKKVKKLKKFCMLPPKDGHGNKDPTWVSVLMTDMDEVTAHTSLFFMNETYERLVGDVGARIEDWVREADSVRLVREMQGS